MAKKVDSPEVVAQMEEWLAKASDALHIPVGKVIDLSSDILDLVGDVSRGPSRPGAPLTAYLIGYVAGSGGDPEEAVVTLKRLVELE